MPRIKDLSGKIVETKCIGCDILKGKIKSVNSFIVQTNSFTIEQDFEVPIPGFFVISSKRHIIGFADFNNKEKKEFMDIICKLRSGMRDILKIKYITLLFREDTVESKVNPSHFHVALLPKSGWMKKFSTTQQILNHAKKEMNTKTNIQKIKLVSTKMRQYFF